jgi:hypothetical protein
LGKIRVGAVTWDVAQWQENFYPLDLPDDWRLPYYANEFHTTTVDIDSLHDDRLDTLTEWLMDCHEEFRVILRTGDLAANKDRINNLLKQIEQLEDEVPAKPVAGIWHYDKVSEQDVLQPVNNGQVADESTSGAGVLALSLDSDLRGMATRVSQFFAGQNNDEDSYIIATSGYEDILLLRQLVEIVRLTAG